jgi:hypothetical protein
MEFSIAGPALLPGMDGVLHANRAPTAWKNRFLENHGA